ncbi:MAG: hypothetical protein AAF738_00850 [Bacteroidota bacterium]
MNNFTFEAGHKKVLLGGVVLGVLCLLLTFFTDDALHTRFWTNYLHNVSFFTGISFMAMFVLSAFLVAQAGWYTYFKRLWEAKAQFMIVGLVLMLPVVGGVWFGYHHLYHWADAAEVAKDELLVHKSSFINPVWYTVASIIVVGAWWLMASRFRALSIKEDKNPSINFGEHRKQITLAAVYLPVAGFTSALVIWQWIMSLDAHWYSTLFAWYSAVSWFVSMLALSVLLLIFLRGQGYYQNMNSSHLHDLGKYVFAFSVFWTYLWFDQFMLIWYGNIGEETVYFQLRRDEYPLLFFGNLIINFLVPFFVLMRNDTKRKLGSMAFVCVVIIFGHWIDFFLMIKPGAMHTAHEALAHMGAAHGAGHDAAHGAGGMIAGVHFPGLLELGTFVGFLCLYLFVVLNALSKVPLVAKNDPYLEESLHHHVEPPYSETF